MFCIRLRDSEMVGPLWKQMSAWTWDAQGPWGLVLHGSGALPNASTGYRSSLIPHMDTNATLTNGSHFSTVNFLPLVFERRLDFCNRYTAAMQPQAQSSAHWQSGTPYLSQAQGGAPAGELGGTNAHYVILSPAGGPPTIIPGMPPAPGGPVAQGGCPPATPTATLLVERLSR